jgi:hypothetical protein
LSPKPKTTPSASTIPLTHSSGAKDQSRFRLLPGPGSEEYPVRSIPPRYWLQSAPIAGLSSGVGVPCTNAGTVGSLSPPRYWTIPKISPPIRASSTAAEISGIVPERRRSGVGRAGIDAIGGDEPLIAGMTGWTRSVANSHGTETFMRCSLRCVMRVWSKGGMRSIPCSRRTAR